MSKDGRHILSVSGGKDSAALAIYMKDRVPEMEYIFCDTLKELTETYEYLKRLEGVLGKKIERLGIKQNEELGFDYWLKMFGELLPSAQVRWCTRMLKIKPFEDHVGDDLVYSYIGIRADEDRDGYISSKPNIIPVYPFKEDGIVLEDVRRILDENGVGYPEYYNWRTRSGCYFCFFQRKSEWVGLLENHPDLFELAKSYEKVNSRTGEAFTWNQRESLEELSQPERVAEIKARHQKLQEREKKKSSRLVDIFEEALDGEDDDFGCLVCHL